MRASGTQCHRSRHHSLTLICLTSLIAALPNRPPRGLFPCHNALPKRWGKVGRFRATLTRMGEHAASPAGSSQAELPKKGHCLLSASLWGDFYVLLKTLKTCEAQTFSFRRRNVRFIKKAEQTKTTPLFFCEKHALSGSFEMRRLASKRDAGLCRDECAGPSALPGPCFAVITRLRRA